MKNKIAKFAFNKENQSRVQDIFQKYPKGREKSAMLPLLDLAQRQNGGYLTVDVIEYVANLINVPYMRAYEVATFYSMFYLKPVGKYHIQVCGTTPCWLRGASDLVKICEKQIGIKVSETSKDGKFSLSEVECLGACINAPMVQINDDYYEDLDEDKMIKLIDKLNKEK